MSDYNSARNWNMDELRAKVLESQRLRFAMRQNELVVIGFESIFCLIHNKFRAKP